MTHRRIDVRCLVVALALAWAPAWALAQETAPEPEATAETADASPDEAAPDDVRPDDGAAEPEARAPEAAEETVTEWIGEDAPTDEAPSDAPIAERRGRPDYDGRGDPPMDPADGPLWIPRVLFSPLYFLAEFVIRRPLELLVTELERSGAFGEFFVDAFTFNDGQAGIIPTVFFDFGFLPSVGLYIFVNDLLAEGNDLRAIAGTFGPQWLHGEILDRFRLGDRAELGVQLQFFRRPDLVFHGVESGGDGQSPEQRIVQGERTRFGWTNLEGAAHLLVRGWRSSELFLEAGVRRETFENSRFGGQPGIQEGVAAGYFDLPQAFANGYTAFRYRTVLSLDSRRERPAPGHGVRLRGHFEHGIDLDRADENQWIQYGGRLGVFLDTGSQHIVQFLGVVEFADDLQDDDVPFTQLVIPGEEPLVLGGFLPGQLRGRSMAAATVSYRYPIWVWLDATVFFTVGNVYGEHLQDFDLERLRMSFGFGFRTVGDRDAGATLGLALGTEPFDQGGDITSVRFVVGSQQGF
jgi:hypothetical protein